MELCYHASHEQFAPSRLLKLAIMAEDAGFDAIHSSDHFHPWSERQGESGFSFSWLGAAMQATRLPFSVICAPGQRYHPAIVAQAVATLAEMFPGRFNVELGSGEALNELITGDPWPDKDTRNQRLLECADIIRRLLDGEEVSHNGLVKVQEAKLYSRPAIRPKIFAAAISEETSRWAGTWADGLLTTAGDAEETRKKRDAFFQNGGKGKPFIVQYSFSYGDSHEEAINAAYYQWRSNLIGSDKLADLRKPQHFDAEAQGVNKSDVANSIPSITNIGQLMEKIAVYRDLGVCRISLHNISTAHEKFLTDFKTYKNK